MKLNLQSVCKQSFHGTRRFWLASRGISNRDFSEFASSSSSQTPLFEHWIGSFSWCFGSSCLQEDRDEIRSEQARRCDCIDSAYKNEHGARYRSQETEFF